MARYYDFAGTKIILPGAYTQRSFPDNSGAGAIVGEVLILGEAAKGGVPYNAYTEVNDIINVFSDQSQALNVTGGGDVYYGAEFFLTPTKDERFNKPSEAKCIIVNQMTQASGNLQASSVNTIDVKWNIWGTNGNTAAIKLSSGTNTGKLVQAIYKGANILNQDDVDLPLINIRYIGSGSGATMTINETTLSTTCTGDTPSNLSITLANYASLGELVNFINEQASYTCSLAGQSDEKATVFDAVTAQDIKTAEYTALGTVEAIIRILNSTEQMLVSLTTGADRVVPDNTTTYQYLTGGTVSNATTGDWTAALEKLETYNVNNLVIMSGSETIHLLAMNHCENMNKVETKKYRQCGYGAGSAVNTKSLRIKEMKALNSAYVEYCVSPFKRFDYVNNQVPISDFQPYYLYPMIAGLRYANEVGMDVVFKYLNVLSTPEIAFQDQKAYAAAGATFIQKTTNVTSGAQVFEIKCNNTTYQGSQVTRTNPSVVYSINVITKDYEEQVTEKIRALSTVANSVVIANITNWITSYLFPYYRDTKKWITNGPDGQKAFDQVSFSQNGELFYTNAVFTMSVTPRFAFNFFTFVTPGQNI